MARHHQPYKANEKADLGQLAMTFRGTREPAERKAIAVEYAKVLKKLIRNRSWSEMPGPEDQLPDEYMPEEFFQSWLRHPGNS